MTLQNYIDSINQRYQQGNATEHTFRGDLQNLIESLVPTITATNEPKRQACGAPDYIITQKGKEIPIGFIEAKDLGDKDLEGSKKNGNKEQFDRYKISLDNIIFTDYLRFYFYQNQTLIAKVEIAEIVMNQVVSLPENFARFEDLLNHFCTYVGQTIDNSTKLAQMMAVKAKLLAEVIEKSLVYDIQKEEESTLRGQLESFRDILIHDVTPKDFADVYAQTIAYGMFAARYHDKSLDTFSRQEAYELIPKSNPFLKNLFGYIAGLDLDDRILWIVDSLVEIFLATDIAKILQNFGKSTQTEDPIIHFYETFLTEYDPILRKARGVWYTPQPVVNFIVRAVDEILKTEFELKDGLADTSKLRITNYESKKEEEVHRVQILDPATGTGTFLAEIIRHIYKKFEGQQGAWSNYVENNLLPRLNGFELLMASYAMAHLKLDMLLTETGFQSAKNQRFRVFLTNSLEEYHPDTYKLQFATWLSNEANEANRIKRDTPVMCIIGNPPYSGESSNQGQWMDNLMKDYKKEPNSTEKLNERNPKWINDDYVKFIRYGQHFIEKNGSGILAFINPHGFLDNPTFRGMRWNLLKTYDKIYTLDLHGNSKKKETSPDGSTDQNVFDIMQGVSINIFVKTGKKQVNELGKVYHCDLFGKRKSKFDFLNTNSLKTVNYTELTNTAPNYFFVPKNDQGKEVYENGFAINDLFTLNNVGIVTARDEFTIHNSKESLEKTIKEFLSLDDERARYKFKLGKDVRDWQVRFAKTDLSNHFPNKGQFCKISYRPFDDRWTFYTGKTKGFHCYPRYEVMQHFLNGKNLGLIINRPAQGGADNFSDIYLTVNITDQSIFSAMNRSPFICPLYVYPEKRVNQRKLTAFQKRKEKLEKELENAQYLLKEVKKFFKGMVEPYYKKIENPEEHAQNFYEENRSQYEEAKAAVESLEQQLQEGEQISMMPETVELVDNQRQPNLNPEIVNQIAEKLGLEFVPEKSRDAKFCVSTFAPIDILDYIYAVLHSPNYREKYKEFLKIDFPRIPYPTGRDATSCVSTFWKLVQLGSELRQIHLLESPTLDTISTTYPIDGDNVVRKIVETQNIASLRIYINDTQYFDNVPEVAWNFYIGGYQPAQKWLKDRKDRVLSSEEIVHYQKIIVALSETDRLMKQIDTIENE